MLGTRSGDAPRQHLATLGHEAAQEPHVLVVDVVDLVRAELADLPTAEESTTAALSLVLVAACASLAAAAWAASLGSTKSVHRSISLSVNIMSPASSSSFCGPSPGWRSG